jgi:hypothetical protein
VLLSQTHLHRSEISFPDSKTPNGTFCGLRPLPRHCQLLEAPASNQGKYTPWEAIAGHILMTIVTMSQELAPVFSRVLQQLECLAQVAIHPDPIMCVIDRVPSLVFGIGFPIVTPVASHMGSRHKTGSQHDHYRCGSYYTSFFKTPTSFIRCLDGECVNVGLVFPLHAQVVKDRRGGSDTAKEPFLPCPAANLAAPARASLSEPMPYSYSTLRASC